MTRLPLPIFVIFRATYCTACPMHFGFGNFLSLFFLAFCFGFAVFSELHPSPDVTMRVHRNYGIYMCASRLCVISAFYFSFNFVSMTSAAFSRSSTVWVRFSSLLFALDVRFSLLFFDNIFSATWSFAVFVT